MKKILLLEDDLSLSDGLTFALKKQGYDVSAKRTVAEAKSAWNGSVFDLLILDVSLPDGSGFDFCKSVRQSSDVPVIFLTASDEETSVIMGLDIGGDDYVTKPFKLGILMSRVAALLRRANNTPVDNTVLESNGIRIDFLQGQAFRNGKAVELTGVEFKLLCFFMQNPNIVLSKEKLYERLWDSDGNFVDDNTISVYIRRLRTKIEDNPDLPEKIVTVRGLGYKWRVTV
ncbi:MAG: response regulator transcription factor [Clostridia bacterium]|nr:response regulator transcription factor [Clostridia bacterium]